MPAFEIMSTIVRRAGLFLYPLRNTAVDPTNPAWRSLNPGYIFTPNVGIRTVGPITTAFRMFEGSATFNDSDINLWNTSTFTNMAGMFQDCPVFNQPVSNFVTSSVTNMENMFSGCTIFNQSLANFNTSLATSMDSMFFNCRAFNQPLSNFDTSRVINMAGMFFNCINFNQPLSNFVTSSVTDMGGMFQNCNNFNQDISSWNVSNVRSFLNMFFSCNNFNCGQARGVAHNLMQRTATGGWRTNSVANMDEMFNNALAFNGNISAWCVNRIATTPTNFALGANANFTTARQPTWGQCPIP